MSINKNNYENYFLLYIDQELAASDQAAVKNFVQANPEYAAELANLEKTKMVPDTIRYANKAFLYRLPEIEATLPQVFKNKLYKQSSTLLQPNFNYKTKAALLSVAALFILFLGDRFYQAGTNHTWPVQASIISKKNNFSESNNNNPNEIKNVFVSAKNKSKSKPSVKNLEAPNFIVSNESPTRQIQAYPVTEEMLNKPSSLPFIEKTIVPNEMMPSETMTEAPTHTEAPSYKVVDTNEQDRTIYLANFEINGASFRGLTRKLNALLKRNKSEK